MYKRILSTLLASALTATMVVGSVSSAFAAETTVSPVADTEAIANDVNGDGKVDVNDVTALQRALAEKDEAVAKDLNGDGSIDVRDVTFLQRLLAKDPEPTQPTTEETTAPAAETVFVVAGSESLLGANWDGSGATNVMTKDGDVYVLTITADDAIPAPVEFKVVELPAEGDAIWHGDGDFNYKFMVDGAGDVTITYDPATGVATVTGDNVSEVAELEINSVIAVGNGDGTWLNDEAWNPGAEVNMMTETAPGVWTITYEDMDAFDNYNVKFALNGEVTAWADNLGGAFTESGATTDAVYNGDNIVFEVAEDGSTVTLTLDVTNFDASTKTGATFTITIEATGEPTEPTTEPEETTAEPTTEPTEPEETTAEPTTEPVTEPEETTQPTTTEPTTEPAADVVYVVAGSDSLFGVNWVGSPDLAPENVMTDNGDGTYSLTVSAEAAEGYQLKVVENTAEGQNWIGDATGNNITFNVTEACDVTITYNPSTQEIAVTGDGVQFVTNLVIEALRAVGNGDGTWLNDVAWDPADDLNKMEEVVEGVYTITFTDVEEFDNYQIKFAANGSWNDNWGLEAQRAIVVGTDEIATYNGQNIVVEVPYELATVTFTVDLRDFDYATKTGGTIFCTITDQGEPEETTAPEETTEEPEETTAEPTTEPEETTAEPTTEPEAEVTFVVAGSESLFGTNWDGSGATNAMTKDGDVYVLTITADDAISAPVEFKVVELPAEGDAIWHGDGEFNYKFMVTGAGDVTITYDPATGVATVSGDNVSEVAELEINSVIAVGNGDGTWLNDEAWNPGAEVNMMTEITPGVWAITYEDMDAFDNYNVKFALNGEVTGWADNFGGAFTESGASTTAVYNGDNIVFEVAEDGSTVTLTLDVTNFDASTKTGATFTITIEAPVAPTTEPVTEPVPTEPEPTEPEPTTEPTTEPEAEVTYVVAGSSSLLGANWDGSGATNAMTKDGDVYVLTITADDAISAPVEFKVVEIPAEGSAVWHGDGEFNYKFMVNGAGEVTFTYDPATGVATVSGDNVGKVAELEVNSVIAVGNGDGTWLNDEAWNPGAEVNMMTEIQPGVWAITFEDMDAFDNYNVKLALNGEVTGWTDNFGGAFVANGEATTAVYNGNNIVFEVLEDGSTVTIVLDLTNFDASTKTGATFTITIA